MISAIWNASHLESACNKTAVVVLASPKRPPRSLRIATSSCEAECANTKWRARSVSISPLPSGGFSDAVAPSACHPVMIPISFRRSLITWRTTGANWGFFFVSGFERQVSLHWLMAQYLLAPLQAAGGRDPHLRIAGQDAASAVYNRGPCRRGVAALPSVDAGRRHVRHAVRSRGLHLRGGSRNDHAHRETAKASLRHRLPSLRKQHHSRLYASGNWIFCPQCLFYEICCPV